MLQQLLLFLFSIALGAVLGAVYFLLNMLAKSTKLRPMYYIFDVLWCALAFAAFSVLTLFFSGGTFETFALMGMLSGIGIAALLFMKWRPVRHNASTDKPPLP